MPTSGFLSQRGKWIPHSERKARLIMGLLGQMGLRRATAPTMLAASPVTIRRPTVSHSQADDRFPLSETPRRYRLLGKGGKLVSLPTLYRWARTGCFGVKLRAEGSGYCLYTRPSWVEQFLAGLRAA